MKVLWVLVGVGLVAFLLSQYVNRILPESGVSLTAVSGEVAPGFETGRPWINSPPIVLDSVVGPTATESSIRAVLVDFWTYSCINCQRTFPYLRAWWDKYKDRGLLIVGVHSPEFEFEKETANVTQATEKYGISWPVVQDNDHLIWGAYRNNYWPRKYLMNREGTIVYDHIGEGAYEETERQIQKLLGVERVALTTEPESGGMGFDMQQTPELYMNTRGQRSGHLGKGRDKVELVGEWEVTNDYAVAGNEARLKLVFFAGSVNVVTSLSADRGVISRKIDSDSLPPITIEADDLYQLWQGEEGEHTLELAVDEGVRLHAFTFGK